VRLWRDRWAGLQGVDLETLSGAERLQSLQQNNVVRWRHLRARPGQSRTPDQSVDRARNRRRTESPRHCWADFATTRGTSAQKGGLQPHPFRYWLTDVPDDQRDEKIREECEVYAGAAERAAQGERTINMTEEFRNLSRLGFVCPGVQSGFVSVSEDLAEPAHRLIRSGNEFTLREQALNEALFWSRSLLFEKEPSSVWMARIGRILLHLLRASQTGCWPMCAKVAEWRYTPMSRPAGYPCARISSNKRRKFGSPCSHQG
jgi:hypothetical protein